MAELQERGQFILDSELDLRRPCFPAGKQPSWFMGGADGGRGWRGLGGEVSGVN